MEVATLWLVAKFVDDKLCRLLVMLRGNWALVKTPPCNLLVGFCYYRIIAYVTWSLSEYTLKSRHLPHRLNTLGPSGSSCGVTTNDWPHCCRPDLEWLDSQA